MAQNKGIRQRAQVTVLAPTDDAPLETPGETTSNSPGSSSSSKPKHDAGLLSRIQKSLALAKHSGTSEAEARQALRLATRLMSTYNVTQADLLVSSSSESDSPSSRGGISTVTITRTDASLDGDGAPKRVLVETWAARAAYAMTIFFDVKAYSTARDTEVVWTFYGIAPNTVAAAMAFETTHNATLTWAMERPEARGRTGKNSYCHGVAAGLVEMAREEKGRELRIAQKMEQRAIRAREQEEKKQRQREVERLQYQEQSEAGPTVKAEPDTSRNADGISAVKPEAEPDSEPTPRIKREPQPVKLEDAPDGASSDDDEFFDAPLDLHRDDDHRDENATPMIDLTLLEDETKPDFDDREGREVIDLTLSSDEEDGEANVTPKTEPKPEPETEPDPEPAWQSAGALTVFRRAAETIADEVLKSHLGEKAKLRKRRAPAYQQDKKAYDIGRIDARKLDVKRRRIEASETD